MGVVVNEVSASVIEGVKIVSLGQFEDERGAVLHMMRSDSPLFSRFGEIYFSLVNPQTVKGWKYHREMTQSFAVPVGRIRLVIFDDRADSSSSGMVNEIIIGRPECYVLVRIPPRVWYGFKAISDIPALLANCSDMPHDPGEADRRAITDSRIPYRW